MTIKINNQKGFTLMEIMITVLIVAVFFGLIASITEFSARFFRNEDSQVSSQASLRLIATQFEKDVRMHVVTGTEFTNPSAGVYHIRVDASNAIVYRFENNNVYRNAVLIGERVNVFNPNWNETTFSFNLNITSFADGFGRVNQVSVRIFVRTGNGG